MAIRCRILAGLTLTLVTGGVVSGAGDGAMPFEDVRARFEHNVTDRDAEVVFEVNGGDTGLVELTVASPEGRTVVEFAAPDSSTLGIRSFQLESPEPEDIEGLKKAYSQGTYAFTATNLSGDRLYGESTLNHDLPAPVVILRPGPGATDVGTADVEVAWTPVDDAAAYIIEIDQDDLGIKFKARLPGTVHALPVPAGVLHPGLQYELSIGSVSSDGNISIVETTFTTSE